MMRNEILARKFDQIAYDHNMRIECSFNCNRPGKAGFRLPLLMEHIIWHHNKVPFNHYCKTDGCKAEFYGTIDAVAHAKDGHEVVSHDVQQTIKEFWNGREKTAKHWQWEHAYFLHGKMVAEHLIEQLLKEGYLQLGPLCRQEEKTLEYIPSGLDQMGTERSQGIGRAAQASLGAALMENSGGTGNCLGGFRRQPDFASRRSREVYSPRTPVFDDAPGTPLFKPSGNGSGTGDSFENAFKPRDSDRASRGGRGRGGDYRSGGHDETPNNRYAIAGGGGRNDDSHRGRWIRRGGRGGGRGGHGDYRQRNGNDTWLDASSTAVIDNDFANKNYGTSAKRLYADSSTISNTKRRARSYSRSDSEKEDGEVDSENGKTDDRLTPALDGAPRQCSRRSWSGSSSDKDDGPSVIVNKIPAEKLSIKRKTEAGAVPSRERRGRERSYSRSDSD
ncbi:unnamed protein product, partial [Mesorhabditis belari]|uniref:Uncharacterized protein n=1 Tax=Mesorhabditis belari TaxID=2138241 RepID=A0AAF3FT46_9BILA